MGGLRLLWILLSLFLLQAVLSAEDNNSSNTTVPGPPKAKSEPVEETLHGHKIVDSYRYLEDSSNSDTQEFVRDELAYTRSILDPLPGRDKIKKRLEQLLSIGTITVPQIGGKYHFYTRREGMQNQPVLYVREGVDGKDRVLIDANQLASDGTIALDWWQPTHDGKYVAYGTSPSGSEMSTLHVIETASGKTLSDAIDRTRAASIAWKLDDSGFYYTRYPKKGAVPNGQEMYNRHVFYHELGSDPAKDSLIFGEGRDPQDWPDLRLSEDGRWLLIMVEQGWSKSELYLIDLQSRSLKVVRVTNSKDFLYHGDVYKGDIYIVTNEDAPRYRVFKVSTQNSARSNWKEFIPQSEAVLQATTIIHGELFGLYEKNATSQLRVFNLEGQLVSDVQLPGLGTLAGVGGNWDSNEMFFGFQSFTVPPSVYRIDWHAPRGASGRLDPPPARVSDARFKSPMLWAKVDAPSIDVSAYEVNQLWFDSKDGTRVPMFVVNKKGLEKNGRNPTLLTGYGGFNRSLTPSFSGSAYLWMENGGVYAVANLRGGAEFGEDWHRAGMLDKKQNVFDDFIAAAEYLIAQKYTDRDHLAIQGGSNGGLLMGAVFTQRPELFRAVVCQVPLLDMLRYQNFQIAKLWIPEYGSAGDAKQFEWLYAYSPYHHVKEGVEYPAILFMTADSDTRVDPMHAKKMAALMQAQAKNGGSREQPILLRIEPRAGHGAGKPIAKQIEELTDSYSFLFWQLELNL
jgi:prolyl oligopeptidase